MASINEQVVSCCSKRNKLLQMKIDLSFRVQGTTLPADHAYGLFSALCQVLKFLHKESSQGQAGIFSVSGSLIGQRRIKIGPGSRLTLRITSERIADFLPLSGVRLAIGENSIYLGVPEIHALKGAQSLDCRLVTIKNAVEPEGLLRVAAEQLLEMGATSGELHLVKPVHANQLEKSDTPRRRTQGEPIRRTVKIADRVIVGFALEIHDLSETDSILVQENGLGGRRHFGCGLFRPKKERR